MAAEAGSHVLMLPHRGEGHMLPLLDLAHALAALGLRVTILTTPDTQNSVQSFLQSAATSNLRIRPLLFSLPSLDISTQNSMRLAHDLNHHERHLSPQIISWFKDESSHYEFGTPACLISDFFHGWTQKTAQELRIPRAVFYPSGALAVSAAYSQWEHLPHLSVASDDDPVPLPGLPVDATFRKFQLSPLTRQYVGGDPLSEFMRESFLCNFKSSWGLIINTFSEMEGAFISHLEKISGRPVWPVWPVWPLFPPATFEEESVESVGNRGKVPSVNEAACLGFLDRKRERSVVYVCFGSWTVLTQAQVDALACGLEECGADFIWVIGERKNSVNGQESGALPDGFEERVGDRGLVIRGWAPQLLILRHRSVGCFVNHCGWNSVLESVTFGVPLVTWPFTADQHFNDWLVVENLRVGTRLCVGMNALPHKDRIKECVDKLLVNGGDCEERTKVMEISNGARNNGASKQSLLAFIDALSKVSR